MDAQLEMKKYIDLSHDDKSIDNSLESEEKQDDEDVSSQTTYITEMTEDENIQQDKALNGGESIKLRKKSMGHSDSPDNLLGKDECHGGDGDSSSSMQFGNNRELNKTEKVEERKTEVVGGKERPISTFQQIAMFLCLFVVLVIVNQGAIKLILYFFNPDDTTESDGKGLEDVDYSKYEQEQEFSEFDRLMEH